MKQTFLTVLMMLLPMLASADAVEIDGIWYDLDADAKEAKVTTSPKRYSGDVVIPESVTMDGVQYAVTAIGEMAFMECKSLTSISIPKSVTSVGSWALSGCGGLTAVHISDLKAWCEMATESSLLEDARHLYLNGEEVKGDLVIPDGVTSIVDYAFSRLDLNSVTIPGSVTSIGYMAFSHSKLISVTISEGVTTIQGHAFYDCYQLNSVTLPNSLTFLGNNAFAYCGSLSVVVSLIEEPFKIESFSMYMPFSKEACDNGTLYVPVGTIEKYQSTDGWNKFQHMEEGSGPGGQTGIVSVQADPVLVVSNGGVLSISGAPTGAEINVYSLSGQKVGSAKATSGSADVFTTLQAGEVGIVEIGSKTVKVVVK